MRKRILIIDDDVELCSLLLRCLEREGYEVCAAHTGAAGLNRLEEKEVTLVILDVMLPEMSGFDVLTEIRKTKSTPVPVSYTHLFRHIGNNRLSDVPNDEPGCDRLI